MDMLWILVVIVLVLVIGLGVVSVIMFQKLKAIEQQVNTLNTTQHEMGHSLDESMNMLRKSMDELSQLVKMDDSSKTNRQSMTNKRKGQIICQNCYEAFSIRDRNCPKCGSKNNYDS